MSRTQLAFNSGDLAFQEIITSRLCRDPINYYKRGCRYWMATSSASLAATSAIGASAVLRPLREPSRGLTSRRASPTAASVYGPLVLRSLRVVSEGRWARRLHEHGVLARFRYNPKTCRHLISIATWNSSERRSIWTRQLAGTSSVQIKPPQPKNLLPSISSENPATIRIDNFEFQSNASERQTTNTIEMVTELPSCIPNLPCSKTSEVQFDFVPQKSGHEGAVSDAAR